MCKHDNELKRRKNVGSTYEKLIDNLNKTSLNMRKSKKR